MSSTSFFITGKIAALILTAVVSARCSGSTILSGSAQDGREDVSWPDAPDFGPDMPVDLPDDEADAPPCPGGCADATPCTSDACVDGSCVYTPVADGTPCSPGGRCPDDGACEDGACVTPLRPDEGSILWAMPLETPDHGTAVLHESGGDLIVLTAARAERLRVDGSVVWSVPAYLSGNLGQLESLIAGDVVVTAQYDELVGLDLGSGDEVWRADAGGYIDSTVLGTDGLVMVASVNLMSGPFMLRAFEPATGARVWGFEVDIRIGEMAVREDGMIYASNGGQSDSPGYVIGLPGGARGSRWTAWARPSSPIPSCASGPRARSSRPSGNS